MLGTNPQTDGVTFRVPLMQWAFGVLRVFLVFILLWTVLGGALIGLAVSVTSPSAAAPAWVLPAVIVSLLVALALAISLGRKDLRRKIALGVDSLWIGGLFFGSIVPYESVRLVRLAFPRKTVGNVHQVVIERGGRKPASIWLKQRDAEECFAALREFCDRAAAVGKHEELYRPRDSEYEAEATLVLAASLRRRALRTALVCALILLWWGGMLSAVLFAGSSSRGGRGPGGGGVGGLWHLLVVLPIAAAGLAASALRDRREAKRHVAAVLQMRRQ